MPKELGTFSRRRFAGRSLLATAALAGGYLSYEPAQDSQLASFQCDTVGPLSQPHAGPLFATQMIQHTPPLGFVHCASICEGRSGEMLCSWYGGSREGARDVNLWIARQTADFQWSEPESILSVQQASAQAGSWIKKIGNSVIFNDDSDRLWMVFVSIAFGGWSCSSLNACWSDDSGRNWSEPKRLQLSPLLNLSELVRCPPVRMSDGGIGLPIYHECLQVFPEILWLKPNVSGLTYTKSRMCGGRSWLQPSVVPTGPQTALCYLRCASTARRVGVQRTFDAGQSWTHPEFLELPNPNSAVCGLRLERGGCLLALNLSTDKRDSISLVYSADGLTNWRVVSMLDQKTDGKFSYPSMIRSKDGSIHLVYSWQMSRIKHLQFNDAWVYQQLHQALPTQSPFELAA